MTSQTKPTIWADLPFAGTQIEKLRLVIYDSQNPDRILQLKSIASPNQPGIIAVQLPKSLPGPQTYQWKLTGMIRCDNGPIPGPMQELAGGWIEYKPAIGDLQTQLTQAELIDQASLYASHGYWLDALAIVGRNRMPGIDPSWSLLLSSLGQSDRMGLPIEFR